MRITGLILLISILACLKLKAQEVLYPIENRDLYEFLDLISTKTNINLKSVTKPYSRRLISEILHEAVEQDSLLTRVQLETCEFYLKDFRKEVLNSDRKKRRDLYFYQDSLFTFSVNPIIGFRSFENGKNYHRFNGGEAFAYLGKSLGFYASLRDNLEKNPLSNPNFLVNRTGAAYKSNSEGNGEYSKMKGGFILSNSWGSIGIVKDHINWGDHFNGANIVGNVAPSFPMIKLKLNPTKWLQIDYFHGWLNSGVRDTINTYNAGERDRVILVSKFMAANMITFTPWIKLNFSLGNSIVYSDNFNPVYLIPLMFFKSVDHTTYFGTGNYGGQNAQMFFNVSSRQLKNIHIYLSTFVDEISLSRMWDASSHSNFISFKIGARNHDLLIPNLSIGLEYTRNNPITYRHFVSTTTFTTNDYNLGHYLRDNSQDLHIDLAYRIKANLRAKISYELIKKGEEHVYTGTNNTGLGLSFLDQVEYKHELIRGEMIWEPLNDLFVNLRVEYIRQNANEIFSPIRDGFYLGGGFNVGF